MGARAAGDVVVEEAWLVPRLADPEVVVADVRWYLDGRSGREAYEAGHVPGAVFVDIDADLSEPVDAAAGRHPLPSTSAFAESMGSLGIGDGTTVVAYDDSGGATAGRLVWMLRALGQGAALLDGGLGSWQGPLETGAGRPRSRVRLTVPSDWPGDRFARTDEVAAARGVILDARMSERYEGGAPGIDPRPGHIPGARNAPWAANLGDDGRIASVDDLRALRLPRGRTWHRRDRVLRLGCVGLHRPAGARARRTRPRPVVRRQLVGVGRRSRPPHRDRRRSRIGRVARGRHPAVSPSRMRSHQGLAQAP